MSEPAKLPPKQPPRKRVKRPPPPPPPPRHGLVRITAAIVGMMALGAALGVLAAHFAH